MSLIAFLTDPEMDEESRKHMAVWSVQLLVGLRGRVGGGRTGSHSNLLFHSLFLISNEASLDVSSLGKLWP